MPGGAVERPEASQRRGDLETRQVIQRCHGLVAAQVTDPGDPPAGVSAALVALLAEPRARDDYPVPGRQHGFPVRPDAGRRVAVDRDLRLGRGVTGQHGRSELGAEERDDLGPAADLHQLAERARTGVEDGALGERVADFVPQLQVDAAQVAVLHLADLFDIAKLLDRAHAHLLLLRCPSRAASRKLESALTLSAPARFLLAREWLENMLTNFGYGRYYCSVSMAHQ
jgi:hypothetical protein